MPVRALPALLALVAFLADLSGAHRLALLVLFVAIPAGFALVVSCYGDNAEGRTGLLRALLAAAGLGLLVTSAALRSPAVVGGVPRLAITALALAPFPCLYGALRVTQRRRSVPAVLTVDEPEDLADAA